MSVDDRLRSGLARNAEAFRPDVEGRLHRTLRQGRRRRLSMLLVPVASAAVAVLVVLAWVSWSPHRAVPPPAGTTQSSTGPTALLGSWSATLPSSSAAGDAHLAGRWTLSLAADGSMRVSAPSAYTGVLSGALFNAAATGTFRTTLFGQDLCSGTAPGRYRWTRAGGTLTFTVTDDPCAGRVLVLARSWTSGR
jgi:hypothetical protein